MGQNLVKGGSKFGVLYSILSREYAPASPSGARALKRTPKPGTVHASWGRHHGTAKVAGLDGDVTSISVTGGILTYFKPVIEPKNPIRNPVMKVKGAVISQIMGPMMGMLKSTCSAIMSTLDKVPKMGPNMGLPPVCRERVGVVYSTYTILFVLSIRNRPMWRVVLTPPPLAHTRTRPRALMVFCDKHLNVRCLTIRILRYDAGRGLTRNG